VRIFQAITPHSNASVPDSRTWWRNLHEPLLDQRRVVRRGKSRPAESREALSQRLVDEFRRAHAARPFALVFTYLSDAIVRPEALGEIAAGGVPVVNFSCNNAHQFEATSGIARQFTVNHHAEQPAGEKFRAIADFRGYPEAEG